MSEIHYFPRYSQAENFVTNNTLLLLLRLFQYSRFKFERFMELLCADQDVQLATSWLQFSQQKGTGRSVLDGFIAQDSVKIAVETKLGDTFDRNQLERHLEVFGDEQHKLLILLSPSLGAASIAELGTIRVSARSKNIVILHTSFEQVIDKAKACLSDHDEEMLSLVDDYESFCSEMELMPMDEFALFVPPCGRSIESNLRLRLYYCPATWSRRGTRYLGIYARRSIRAIGRISKVVACDVNSDQETVDLRDGAGNLTADEKHRILSATHEAIDFGWDIARGHKFYLCDSMEDTDFRKPTPGGIMGHRYFDLKQVLGHDVPKNLSTLAAELRQREWSASSS